MNAVENVSDKDTKQKTKPHGISTGGDGNLKADNSQMRPNDTKADIAPQKKMQNVTRILINATHPRQLNGKYNPNAYKHRRQ